MFGKKKALAEDLISDDLDEDSQSKNNIKGQNAKFIFYNDNKKFSKQIELYAVLNSSENAKVLVVIDNSVSVDFLCIKIAESFEQYPEYKDLEGLKAINLTKKNEKLIDIPLPTSGLLENLVINGDLIYFDFITNEYWVKVSVSIFLGNKQASKLNFTMDLKVRLDTQFKNFKYILLKCAINCWLDNKKKRESFHYIIANVKLTTTHQGEFNLNGSKADKIDQMLIREIFDFKSEIRVVLNLRTVEEILFLNLLKINDRDDGNRLKWEEFQEFTSVEDLMNNKKFQPEIDFIFSYTNRLLLKPNEQLENTAYVFDRLKDDKESFSRTSEKNASEKSERESENLSASVVQPKKEKYTIIVMPSYSDDFEKIFGDSEVEEQVNSRRNSINSIHPLRKRNKKSSKTNVSQEIFLSSKKVSLHSPQEEEDEEEREINFNELSHYDPYNPFTNPSSNKVKKQTANITALIGKYRDTSKYCNLCKEFSKKLDKETFINEVCAQYKISIQRGVLERIQVPEFRNFVILPEDITVKKGTLDFEETGYDEFVRQNNRQALIFIVWTLIFSGYLLYLILNNY